MLNWYAQLQSENFDVPTLHPDTLKTKIYQGNHMVQDIRLRQNCLDLCVTYNGSIESSDIDDFAHYGHAIKTDSFVKSATAMVPFDNSNNKSSDEHKIIAEIPIDSFAELKYYVLQFKLFYGSFEEKS